MIRVRKAAQRGRTALGWLDSKHTFSFGAYRDPEHVGYGPLRVINDDLVAGAGGFSPHEHRDMEIVSIVLDGALEHRDSTGGGGVLRRGDVQAMSAGAGVTHSEFNHSESDTVRFLQVWIEPRERGIEPAYADASFDFSGGLVPVATPDGAGASLAINQDASILVGDVAPGASVRHELAGGRRAWVQVAEGDVTVNGETLAEGDGGAVEGEGAVEIAGAGSVAARVVLFDLPGD